jgi:hypothetical protein
MRESKTSDAHARDWLDEKIDVAVLPSIASRDRSKYRNPRNAFPSKPFSLGLKALYRVGKSISSPKMQPRVVVHNH